MSDSDENFDLGVSGSDSDGYEPVPKKGKAAPKKAPAKATSKAAAKPKVTKKKPNKVLVDKDDNADSDDDSMVVDEPASAAGPSTPPTAKSAPAKKNKTASETYTKVCGVRIQRRV